MCVCVCERQTDSWRWLSAVTSTAADLPYPKLSTVSVSSRLLLVNPTKKRSTTSSSCPTNRSRRKSPTLTRYANKSHDCFRCLISFADLLASDCCRFYPSRSAWRVSRSLPRFVPVSVIIQLWLIVFFSFRFLHRRCTIPTKR